MTTRSRLLRMAVMYNGRMKFRTAEMTEGPEAFDRFRKAMTTIVAVPKTVVVEREKARTKRKRPAARKG